MVCGAPRLDFKLTNIPYFEFTHIMIMKTSYRFDLSHDRSFSKEKLRIKEKSSFGKTATSPKSSTFIAVL